MDPMKNQQRTSGNIKPSSSSANLNKQQLSASSFDVLSSLGGDLNSAVAALTAAASGGLDNASALAQLNVLAQLNQIAASNPKMAAAAMLQLQQQHFGNQSQSSSLSLNNSLSIPSSVNSQMNSMHSLNSGGSSASLASNAASGQSNVKMNQTRYQQLLNIIEEMGREIRTSYSGNKNSIERLKRGIASARILVKDCQIECDRNVKQ